MGITRIPDKSWEEALAPPKPLVKKLNEATYGYTYYMPAPDNDGSYIMLPRYSGAGSSSLQRYNAAGTLVWSVLGTDIDANADSWTGVFWLDTVDSAIWVWVYNTGTSPDTYTLAKVALSDGTVTVVGTCQPGDSLFRNIFRYYYFERASMGSGDLAIRYGDQKIVLNTSDGSIVSGPTQVTQNGVAINGSAGYQTSDGSIYLVELRIDSYGCSAVLMRGGTCKSVQLPRTMPGVRGSIANAILWDGYVAIYINVTNIASGGRFFNRTDFDNWLKRIADYYGFPE